MQPQSPMQRPALPPVVASMLDAATRAYSPQNSQPWRFTLAPDGVYAGLDGRRCFPRIDPRGRLGWVALGAAVENARIAALAAGVNVDVVWQTTPREGPPADDDWPIRLAFLPGQPPPSAAADTALAPAIERRRTYRGRMSAVPVAQSTLSAAARAALPSTRIFEVDPRRRVAVLQIMQRGLAAMIGDGRRRREWQRWYRPWPWQSDTDDGLRSVDLGLGGWRARIYPFLLAPPVGAVFGAPRRQADNIRALASAGGTMVLGVAERDDPIGWFTGGRGWQRAALVFASAGLVTHVVSAPLDVAGPESDLRTLFGVGRGDGLIALARVGVPPRELPPPPARAPEDLLV